MTPLRSIELEPIFVHERTELYRRTRELHAFAAHLEVEAGTSRYFAALTHTGLLAMLSTASAGVAPSDRSRARHLATLRDRLARFASALQSMADRGLLEKDVVCFGNQLVRSAEALVADFDVELRCIDAGLLSDRRDAERSRGAAQAANDEARPTEARPTDADSPSPEKGAAGNVPAGGAQADVEAIVRPHPPGEAQPSGPQVVRMPPDSDDGTQGGRGAVSPERRSAKRPAISTRRKKRKPSTRRN